MTKELDALLRFGLLIESLTFPNLTMIEAVDSILTAVDSGALNLSVIIPPHISSDPLGVVRKLQKVLPTLPQDNNQTLKWIFVPIIGVITIMTTAVRFYAKKKINRIYKADDWCVAVSTVCALLHGLYLWDIIGKSLLMVVGTIVILDNYDVYLSFSASVDT